MISVLSFVGSSSFRARLARFSMVFLVAVLAYVSMLMKTPNSQGRLEIAGTGSVTFVPQATVAVSP